MDTVVITVTNTAPIADAGADTNAHIGDTIVLDGSSSYDPDSDALSYYWTQVSGETVTIGDSTHSPMLRIGGFRYAQPGTTQAGTYKFALSVSDGWDATTDTVVITVYNNAPIADAGADTSVHIGDTVVLDGSNSYDTDGDALSYYWMQVSGESVTMGDAQHTPSSDSVGVHSAQAGTYVFRLSVSDGWDTSVDTVVITVVPAEFNFTDSYVLIDVNPAVDNTINIGDSLSLFIPANSFSSELKRFRIEDINAIRVYEPVLSTIIDNANQNEAGASVLSTFYVTPLNSSGGAITGLLSRAVTLKMGYEDKGGNGIVDNTSLPVSLLKIYRLDESNAAWNAVQDSGLSTVLTDSNFVQVSLTHFSVFALVAKSPVKSGFSEIIVYPNPFIPAQAKDGVLKIINLTATTTVKIYTLLGKLVREYTPADMVNMTYGSNTYFGVKWDGKTAGGVNAASGVYIYYLRDSSGNKKMGKIVVIR